MNIREKAQRLVELDRKAAEDSSSLTDAEWRDFQHLSTDQLASVKIARKLIEALDVLERIAEYDEGGFQEDYDAMGKLAFDFLASLEKED